METICVGCGTPVVRYYFCDQRVEDGPWCRFCFDTERCLTEHGDDCVTVVVDVDDDPPATTETVDLSSWEGD